ncbi:MAG: FAD-dependent oxidoreductase [Kiloniellales bacterium]
MTEKPLPRHASVVVIGGGVMGCSTLYHLAKLGVGDALLLERNKLTSGTTWHSAAQVRALRHSRNLTRMIRYSIALYSRLEEETGQAVGWIQKGSLSIATSPDRLTHIKRQEALAAAFGVEARTISLEEAQACWPLMRADDVIGAVFSPGDGRVSPSDLCAALVKGAKQAGATIHEDCGVTAILTKNGRVVGVETRQGRVACEAVAVCAGLWSRETAALGGAAAPLMACEHFYLLTNAVPGITGNMPTLSDHDSHLYIRDDSGGLLVGCFEPLGKAIAPEQLGPDFAFQLLPEDWDHFEPMMHAALHRLPVLETAEVKMLLNGPESFTPDGTFMLGETAETRGLFLGCGMNSVGVATGGGAGMNLAHAIVHGHMAYDLGEADAKRFAPVFDSAAHLTARAPEVLGKHYEISYPGRQMQSARNLRALPLDSAWRKARAQFGQVYGFERPLYFGKTAEPRLTFGKPDWFEAVGREVAAAHEKAAVFDQSSLGKIEVEGPDAEAFLQRLCANEMARPPGRAIYTAMLNPRAGFESDLTAQRLSQQHYRLFVGTAAVKRDLAWLRGHSEGYRVTLRDCTEEIATLALMGPDAARIARDLGAPELNDLGFFRLGEAVVAGQPVQAVRLSYVGEHGWEISCQASNAEALYAALAEAGARPAGLFAQTAMRIEKRYLAFGHELDGDITPIEAGLDFAVAWSSDFIGREALLRRREQGPASRLVTLLFQEQAVFPLGHEPILFQGEIVGETSSAGYGYRVGCPLALGFVRLTAPEGLEVEVDIARSLHPATLTLAPAFDPKGERLR